MRLRDEGCRARQNLSRTPTWKRCRDIAVASNGGNEFRAPRWIANRGVERQISGGGWRAESERKSEGGREDQRSPMGPHRLVCDMTSPVGLLEILECVLISSVAAGRASWAICEAEATQLRVLLSPIRSELTAARLNDDPPSRPQAPAARIRELADCHARHAGALAKGGKEPA